MHASLIQAGHEEEADLLAEILAPHIQQASEEEAIAEALDVLFGKVALPLTLTVAGVHALWDETYRKGREWERRYTTKIDPLLKRLNDIPRGERKRRKALHDEIASLTTASHRGMRHVRYSFDEATLELQELATKRAQELLAAKKWSSRKQERFIEERLVHFNELWSERCWLETTWQWTLAECLNAALFGAKDASA